MASSGQKKIQDDKIEVLEKLQFVQKIQPITAFH